jgi:ABC-type transporter Mla subunit MlaD
MTGATKQEQQGHTIKMAFDNAFGLTTGGDLRVGGVKAGKTSNFDVSKGRVCQGASPQGPARTCAIVTGQVTLAGFSSFRRDAHCDIRQQSLIGEYYVDCQPGSNPQQLANGATIPVTQTTSTIPTDLVNNILRRPYRDRLRLLIAELGTGLAGRPEALAEVLRRADPGLRETDKTLRILANQNTIIKNFITDSDTVVNQLDVNKKQLARWVSSARNIAEVSATRQTQITQGWQKLPTFLSELKPTMARLNDLTTQQRPLLADLQRAAPSLNTFFKELGPFSEASRPAFRSLGDMSKAGLTAVRDSTDEIKTLRQFAQDAPAVGKPLRQFLQVADNRDRSSHWPDVRAAESAPPAPDPTANVQGKSFTGMEAFWNYFYWQPLALNEFDNIGHVLRALLFVGTECAPYTADARLQANGGTAATEKLYKDCNSSMGPFQPGITATDPTDKNGGANGAPGSTSSVSSSPVPKANSLDKQVGQPAATTPLPGQIDPSRPHVTLPPQLQDLLNALRGHPAPGAPSLPNAGQVSPQVQQQLQQLQQQQGQNGAPSPSPSDMLNFLLSP